MVFLISLALALALALGLNKPLRKNPTPFYIAFAAISLAVAVCSLANVRFPAWVSTWVWPVAARGAMVGALFTLVMTAGAFPNGSAGARALMPVRAQLSILASILAAGHIVTYGKTYIVMLFTNVSRMTRLILIAAVVSLLLVLVMLPLSTTSFASIRKKMNGRTWKKLQRFAYLFYALLYLHIILFNISPAVAGRAGYRLNLFVYSAVFFSYAICRVLKYRAVKTKTQDKLPKRQIVGVICGVLIAALLLDGVMLKAGADARAAEGEAPAAEDITPSDEPEATEPEAPGEATDAPEAIEESGEDAVTASDAGTTVSSGSLYISTIYPYFSAT